MSTVFVGGSRAVSRLPTQAQERLSNVIQVGAKVILGDANGADKAVQTFFAERKYPKVTVYCSGDECRNNVGGWDMRHIAPPKGAGGFDFYAAKDRIMAREADYGLMIWDGKSAGTILNILRLINAGRKAVLINVPEKTATNFKSASDWLSFYSTCTPGLRKDVRKRANDNEWIEIEQPTQTSWLDDRYPPLGSFHSLHADDEVMAQINAALSAGNSRAVVEALGNLARARGIDHVAKEADVARESLYRSLASTGNPEFATILKVLSLMGLKLMVQTTKNADSN